jgi:hypothetical protein
MKSTIRSHIIAVGTLWASLIFGGASLAQSPTGVEQVRHNFETRSELESAATAAEAKGDKREAWLIRDRLDHGDFREGDRIVIKVQGSAGFSDTVIVRSGKRVQLPQMADLSLDGVLRSELTPRLTTHIARYLRDPVVQATPLVRVGILGSVSRPGFFYSPADLPLADVLMSAGGPTSDADLDKTSVRREGQVIIDEDNTRLALSEGMSMDMLHMEAGDEISVGQQRHLSWGVIVPTVTGILGLLIAFTQIHH